MQRNLAFDAGKGDAPNVWSVDDITQRIKGLLEKSFDRVWVEGEVVSCRPASSGHVYFKLKGRNASLSCVLFRSSASRLSRPLRDGDLIKCLGRVEVYAPHGQYQLVVQTVQRSGEGELLAQLEALKRKLFAEGLFEPERKRPLPFLPRRIGVVTSPTGAAVRDIVRTIHDRYPAAILLAPAPVQGADAPAALVAAMEQLASVDNVDVIIIGRGGGSLEDLWAFNNEALCRAVARCPKPVVSAVGHEIDRVLTDYVADYQAATPTAAGEAVVPVHKDLEDQLESLSARSAQAIRNSVGAARRAMAMMSERLADPSRMIRDRWQGLDSLQHRLDVGIQRHQQAYASQLQILIERVRANHPQARLKRARETLLGIVDRLDRAWAHSFEIHRTRRQQLHLQLHTLSPRSSLERGYAIVRRKSDGTVVRAHNDVNAGSAVEILLAKGSLEATVDSVNELEER